MKLTYSIQTDIEHQSEVEARVQQLFSVETSIVERATDVNIDFASLASFADLLDAEAVKTPHVVFTLETEAELTMEQQAFLLSHPEAFIGKEYTLADIINNLGDDAHPDEPGRSPW